jgi:hypothetical protein
MAYFINDNSQISASVISCLNLNVLPYIEIESINLLDKNGEIVKNLKQEDVYKLKNQDYEYTTYYN